ncbi:MAG: hypothetical protein Udaeo2_29820 [Candidatus Udaeobacter sp.]|nr:MAG: hypothetical protein Udaeo2_29820 [Candidatus Udaeobacter sp.]
MESLDQDTGLQRTQLTWLNNDSTTSGNGRSQLEANEQRVCIPRSDQTGNAYRLQRDRGLVPMACPRHFLKRLFSGEKRVDARLHDKFGEPNNSAVFFDHRGSKIVYASRGGFIQPAQDLGAFVC